MKIVRQQINTFPVIDGKIGDKPIYVEAITYVAVDGEVLFNEQACRDYESQLPLHLRFCLEHKISNQILFDQVEYHWEVGYTTKSSQTIDEPPGFLRQGGPETYYTHHDHVFMHLIGNFSDVLTWALDNPSFRTHWQVGFLRKMNFVKV